MQWVLLLLLIALLGYLVYDELDIESPTVTKTGRLSEYIVAGSVYEDIPTALKRGIRLLELHVYSDEQDQPVVASRPAQEGYDFTLNNVSFEQCCVDIVNDGFPSEYPLIVSVVPHTNKSIVWDRVAEHLQTTVRRHLFSQKDIQGIPLSELANKLILVSGGPIHGTKFEDMLNMSWNDSNLRRLSYVQAQHPRDPAELTAFNEDFITIVGPDSDLKSFTRNPKQPLAYGCQWNVFLKDPPGFTEKISVKT